MNKLTRDKRVQIVSALIEGCSINATRRMCGVSKLTVLRLLADVGQLCKDLHELTVTNVKAQRVQCDEIWSFVGCKQKTKMAGGLGDGDCWTFVALDADSKLIVSYLVGLRDSGHTFEFMRDLAGRLAGRVQLTTDGFNAYREAVPSAFGSAVDFGTCEKNYARIEGKRASVKYSPSKIVSVRKVAWIGQPDQDEISTSYIERQNLTARMLNRRFTRLTNGFSKRWVNHEHAIALHYWWYNFGRKHQTHGKTPAMAACLAEAPWTTDSLVALLEDEERLQAKGGRINRADRT